MSRLKQYITKYSQRRKAKKSRYKLSNISRLKQAKIIDFVNEFCIGYYVDEHNTKPTIHSLDTPVYNKFGLHSAGTELLINIMIKEKYISPISYEDNEIVDEFTCNSNGFDLYFKGGLKRKIIKERNTRILIIIGGISSAIAGMYYLWLLFSDLNKSFHWFCI